MICKRCQRTLRSSEILKCGICESCFHMQCVNDSGKEQRERRDCGDRGYQWKCSLCQNFIRSGHSSGSEISKDKDDKHNIILQAINAISEKFELVNKIQLPKLSSELVQIKTVADQIVQQNEHILKKFIEVEEKRKEDKEVYTTSSMRYRKRNLKLSPKLGNVTGKNNELPVPMSEKCARYRARRRSYILHKIFKILNRKKHKSASPRN